MQETAPLPLPVSLTLVVQQFLCLIFFAASTDGKLIREERRRRERRTRRRRSKERVRGKIGWKRKEERQ